MGVWSGSRGLERVVEIGEDLTVYIVPIFKCVFDGATSAGSGRLLLITCQWRVGYLPPAYD
jgi:hypothetical protein